MPASLQHRINAGRVAVNNQLEFFGRQFGAVASDWKDDDTRVTFADFAITERIFAELRRSFPQDVYCSEESNPEDESYELPPRGFAWILDPVDGTNNFAMGIPLCAISLALLQGGIPVYGFIYDYGRRVLLEGGPGFPLLENRRKLLLKPEQRPHTYIGFDFPLPPEWLTRLAPLLSIHRVRVFGSSAVVCAHTTIGLLDGLVDFRVKIWDIAAGCALIQAAGGEFHFFGDDLFPLQQFDVRMPAAPCFAGPSAFCREVKALLI